MLTVTVTREFKEDQSGDYTYRFEGVGDGHVDSGTGDIDLSGHGNRKKIRIRFKIGEPFDSKKPTVGFADNPVRFEAPAGLFDGITRVNDKELKLIDDNENDKLQGYEYTLYFDDGTVCDPRIINRN